MLVTALGMEIFLRAVQLSNAAYPILVKLWGSRTFVRLGQDSNISFPTKLIPEGRLTLCNPVQVENA